MNEKVITRPLHSFKTKIGNYFTQHTEISTYSQAKWETEKYVTNKQNKTSEKDFNGTEISNLAYKEFIVMVTKVLTELRRTNVHHETFNNRIENTKKVPNRQHGADK